MSRAPAAPGPLAPVLPCVEANLEVLLRCAGVQDVLTVLAAPCSIDVVPLRDPVLTPVPLPDWVHRSTGLRLVRDEAPDGPGLAGAVRAVVASGRPALVVADAFTVPWNPYAGHEHHEHGFVVDLLDGDRAHVVDAYTNVTRYGPSEPGGRWVDLADLLDRLRPAGAGFEVRHLAGEPAPADAAALAEEAVAANVAHHRHSAGLGRDASALAAFAAGTLGPDELAWLSLAVWLLTRSRQAHTRWWQERGGDPAVAAATEAVLAGWRTAQTMSYLAWRRVEAGQPYPATLGAVLGQAAAAEAAWFDAMAVG